MSEGKTPVTQGDRKLSFGDIERDAVCIGPQNYVIHRVRHDGKPEFDKGELSRIIACWNACKGVSTDALESHDNLADAFISAKTAKLETELNIANQDKQMLLEALKPLADIPYQDFDYRSRGDSYPVMSWNDKAITIGDIRKARNAIAQCTKEPT